MGQKKNQPADYINRPLLELFIINHKQTLMEFNQLYQLVERVESQVKTISRPVNEKEKEFYTIQDVTKMLSISTRTLLTFRNEGKIGFTKYRKTIRFTRKDIEEFRG